MPDSTCDETGCAGASLPSRSLLFAKDGDLHSAVCDGCMAGHLPAFTSQYNAATFVPVTATDLYGHLTSAVKSIAHCKPVDARTAPSRHLVLGQTHGNVLLHSYAAALFGCAVCTLAEETSLAMSKTVPISPHLSLLALNHPVSLTAATSASSAVPVGAIVGGVVGGVVGLLAIVLLVVYFYRRPSLRARRQDEELLARIDPFHVPPNVGSVAPSTVALTPAATQQQPEKDPHDRRRRKRRKRTKPQAQAAEGRIDAFELTDTTGSTNPSSSGSGSGSGSGAGSQHERLRGRIEETEGRILQLQRTRVRSRELAELQRELRTLREELERMREAQRRRREREAVDEALPEYAE